MSELVKVELGAVQETLLIPLLGRAEETKKKRALIRDPKAVEIVESLDYDFAKWKGVRSLLGATIRTRMYDHFVEVFLETHPAGTVVELGCGLNTRFERVDNGQVRWFDLDLPDVIALRRRYFADEDRRTMLAASVLDASWMDPVGQTGGPWLFLSEAVLIYLEESDARRAIRQIVERFPGAELVLDTTSAAMVRGQARHDAMRHLPPTSWFRWACNDPRELESLDLELLESKTFLDAHPGLVASLPWTLRVLVRWAPGLLRRGVGGYRLNRLRARGGTEPSAFLAPK